MNSENFSHRAKELARWPRRIIVFIGLLLFLPALVFGQESAQTATLKLYVTDFDTGIALQYADVLVRDTGISGSTDHNGVVELTGIPAGVHLVEVTCEKYEGDVLVITFEAGESKEGDLKLLKAPIELDGIEVVDERVIGALERRGFYERQESGMGRYLSKAKMDERGSVLLSEAVRTMTGVSVIVYEGANVVVSRRRGRTCPLQVFVDGMQMFGYLGGDGENIVDIDTIPLEEVAGVEVYIGPSETPIEYSRYTQCGVLLIWSRL